MKSVNTRKLRVSNAQPYLPILWGRIWFHISVLLDANLEVMDSSFVTTLLLPPPQPSDLQLLSMFALAYVRFSSVEVIIMVVSLPDQCLLLRCSCLASNGNHGQKEQHIIWIREQRGNKCIKWETFKQKTMTWTAYQAQDLDTLHWCLARACSHLTLAHCFTKISWWTWCTNILSLDCRQMSKTELILT